MSLIPLSCLSMATPTPAAVIPAPRAANLPEIPDVSFPTCPENALIRPRPLFRPLDRPESLAPTKTFRYADVDFAIQIPNCALSFWSSSSASGAGGSKENMNCSGRDGA